MRVRGETTVGSLLAAAALSLGALSPAPVAAQDVDARWLPWVGCWEQVGAPADEAMLCVRPAAEGVELLTVSGGEVRETVSLRADGMERPTEEEGCSGTERTEFSADAARVYRSSNLECGAAIGRVSSRMWAMVTPSQWIDVRSILVDGQGAAWVERYRPASASRVEGAGLTGTTAGWGTAIESARMAASAPIGVDDLIEAHAAVGDEVVKSWIAERGEPIRLDADRLVRLADAGVPAEVIDVAVAVSYPERFDVARENRGVPRSAYGARYPLYVDPFGCNSYSRFSSRYCYDRFGYYGGYGNRYGFGGYGYGGYGYGGPTVVVVRPTESSVGGGRMVKGQGYTRPGSDGSGAQAVRPRSGSNTGASATTRSTGSSSSGKARTAKPRTAKPRGGGNQ